MSRFDYVPIKTPARNVFDLSHDVKSSYKFDYLYPFLCEEIVPGDTFNCRVEAFLRTMPLLTPVMHNVDMHVWFIFVPCRLAWNQNRKDDFKVFITGGEKGTDYPEKPFYTWAQIKAISQDPQVEVGVLPDAWQKRIEVGCLMDHLGMPSLLHGQTPGESTQKIDSIPLRCYQVAYNDLFRNQNVQDEIEFSFDSGQETNVNLAKLLTLRRKNWEKDYFTSCLPFQQRGEAQPLPLDMTNATLSVRPGVANEFLSVALNRDGLVRSSYINDGETDYDIGIDAQGKLQARQYAGGAAVSGEIMSVDNETTISMEDIASRLSLAGVSVGTINDLRTAYRIQMWLENNARCGSRYIEQILSHFGVMSSDARMQRPELLGGGKIPLIFTDIPQNSGTVDNDEYPTVQGNLSGKGTLYGKTDGFKKSFEEHGWLFGILSIVPRTSYQEFLHRKFQRFSRFDYYFPEFANLSEQAVLRKEVHFDPSIFNLSSDEEVFGYQERFCEMRYIPSTVHGQMRDTLQAWHLGRVLPPYPVLNSDFVTAKTRADIFAITDVQEGTADPFVCQLHLDIKAVRPLPKYGIPSL